MAWEEWRSAWELRDCLGRLGISDLRLGQSRKFLMHWKTLRRSLAFSDMPARESITGSRQDAPNYTLRNGLTFRERWKRSINVKKFHWGSIAIAPWPSIWPNGYSAYILSWKQSILAVCRSSFTSDRCEPSFWVSGGESSSRAWSWKDEICRSPRCRRGWPWRSAWESCKTTQKKDT